MKVEISSSPSPNAKMSMVSALPDTGATKSIISSKFQQRYNLSCDPNKTEPIAAANGSRLTCTGTSCFTIHFKGLSVPISALITPDITTDFLICTSDLKKLQVIPPNFPNDRVKVNVTISAEKAKKPAAEKPPAIDANFDEQIQKLLTEFKDVFNEDDLPPARGDPVHIYVDRSAPDYKPTQVYTPRRTPLHFEQAADDVLQWYIKTGIVVKVDPDEPPTEYTSPAFWVPKSNGKARLVVDYTGINKYITRNPHPFLSPRDIVKSIKPTSKYFLAFDLLSGYNQVLLDEESSKLTTFLLPSGRYRFTRAPMGLNISSDVFNYRVDIAFLPLREKLIHIVDDGLLQSPDKQQLLKDFRDTLMLCRKNRLTLSRKKLQIGTSVKFAGYVISHSGIKPDPTKIAALKNFPVPTNVTDLRSFLGLANQLGFFLPDLAHTVAPMRELLQKKSAFLWTETHQKAFEQTISILTSDLVVKPYDPALSTILLTDASRLKGLGYGLCQEQKDGTLSLVQCSSRTLTACERNYAVSELETLAIVYAIEDCKYYLAGSPHFAIYTDHSALVKMLQQPLADVKNARILRFRERLTDYKFSVFYTPGSEHYLADALSRAPHFSPPEPDSSNSATYLIASDPQLQFLYNAAEEDDDYRAICQALKKNTRPNDLPPQHPARVLKNIWEDLSLLDGTLIIYNASRIYVPTSARPEVLRNLHHAHQGILKTMQLAKQSFYWPGMTSAITALVNSCEKCQVLRPSQHEAVVQRLPKMTKPMHLVSLDLLDYQGASHLIMVDNYSGYIWVSKPLYSTTTSVIVNIITGWIMDYGLPCVIYSDQGPQFSSKEFAAFCEENHIKHLTSSPHFPQSNGAAERAVATAKALLSKSDNYVDFRRRLLSLRNTPTAGSSLSPAELLFSYGQRTSLPRLYDYPHDRFKADTSADSLDPLAAGDLVRIQDPLTKKWALKGEILEICDSGRSYVVRTEDGAVYRRNRRFLKLLPPVAVAPSPPTHTPPPPDTTPPAPILRRSKRLQEKQERKVTFCDGQPLEQNRDPGERRTGGRQRL